VDALAMAVAMVPVRAPSKFVPYPFQVGCMSIRYPVLVEHNITIHSFIHISIYSYTYLICPHVHPANYSLEPTMHDRLSGLHFENQTNIVCRAINHPTSIHSIQVISQVDWIIERYKIGFHQNITIIWTP